MDVADAFACLLRHRLNHGHDAPPRADDYPAWAPSRLLDLKGLTPYDFAVLWWAERTGMATPHVLNYAERAAFDRRWDAWRYSGIVSSALLIVELREAGIDPSVLELLWQRWDVEGGGL